VYKKGSAWKRGNWDKWTIWKKVRHVIAVICACLASIVMFLIAAWVVLIVFSIEGFITKTLENILLEIAHWLFD